MEPYNREGLTPSNLTIVTYTIRRTLPGGRRETVVRTDLWCPRWRAEVVDALSAGPLPLSRDAEIVAVA